MKINVSSVSRSVDSTMEVTGGVEVSQIQFGSEDIIVKSPVVVNAVVLNTGDGLLINGTINATLTLKCSRCLEYFEYFLEAPFEETLSNKHNDGDAVYFEGDIVDIDDIVINNILLSLPMKFICSESCKGLCPKCGENINVNKCSCAVENTDPRLAVLKDLLRNN